MFRWLNPPPPSDSTAAKPTEAQTTTVTPPAPWSVFFSTVFFSYRLSLDQQITSAASAKTPSTDPKSVCLVAITMTSDVSPTSLNLLPVTRASLCCRRQNVSLTQAQPHLLRKFGALNHIYCNQPTCTRFISPISQGTLFGGGLPVYDCPAPGYTVCRVS